MALVVLSIHLLVCICLIGLVLLQRSEGGALGMGGGGGGGSLMSGRGAADALAKMTSVAGGFFLVTSLSLTVISGAASTGEGRSVLDLIPQSSAPATIPESAPPAAEPEQQNPDPTESRAPSNSQFVSIGPSEASAATPAPNAAATRAGPIEQRATNTAAAAPPRTTPASTSQPAAQPPASQPRTAPASSQQRSTPATTQPAASQPAVSTSDGAVNGIDLTTDATPDAESIEVGNGLEAVRRERAGPDQ